MRTQQHCCLMHLLQRCMVGIWASCCIRQSSHGPHGSVSIWLESGIRPRTSSAGFAPSLLSRSLNVGSDKQADKAAPVRHINNWDYSVAARTVGVSSYQCKYHTSCTGVLISSTCLKPPQLSVSKIFRDELSINMASVAMALLYQTMVSSYSMYGGASSG